MGDIIDGKALAERIFTDVKLEVAKLATAPRLVAVAVGDDKASAAYTKRQAKLAQSCGILYRLDNLPSEAPESALRAHLETLNRDPGVSAVILQTPLPRSFDLVRCRDAIALGKDVEGVTTLAAGRLAMQKAVIAPCTAEAALHCLRAAIPDLRGLEVAVVGRSDIVGKPLALLLIHESATVTVCHRQTRDLAEVLRRADAIIAAAGSAGLVRAEMVKAGAVVVDVGTNAVTAPDGSTKLVGDVDFEAVKERARAITPVPGGVGQVTVAMLMRNAVRLARAAAETCT
jgi:methylenetetrahydrofolate dehydrogenase (NADP+) / methenyltetrahydrofolate cyclohydrolase